MTIEGLIEWAGTWPACSEAFAWLRTLPREADARLAWEECHRADWLLWWAQRRDGVTMQEITLAACACVRAVLHLLPEGEYRPRFAVVTAEAWCKGELPIHDAQRASEESLKASNAFSYSGMYCAEDVTWAAYEAHQNASTCAEHAARAADEAGVQVDFASIVRRFIPWEHVEMEVAQ